MRDPRSRSTLGNLSLIMATLLIAAVPVSAEMKSGAGDNDEPSEGSVISITIDGVLFSHTLGGETGQVARNALVALIDAHPNFQAYTGVTVPPGFGANDAVYGVLTASGTDVNGAIACETDGNFQNVGVHFNKSRDEMVLLKPTSVAGGGIFNLRLVMVSFPEVNQNFPTFSNDAAGLISAITTALTGLGYTVTDNGTELVIRRAGGMFLSARVETTDTGITTNCVGLRKAPSSPNQRSRSGIPALGTWTTIGLVAGLLLLGVFVIARRM